MHSDTVSVILRSASFIALLQAAGMAGFLALFGRRLERSQLLIRRIATYSALIAMLLLLGQYGMEAARMADDLSGILDPSLQLLVLHSSLSLVLGVRIVGLLVLAMTLSRREGSTAVSATAAAIVAASFLLTGHTAASPLRWALAPLLMIHMLIVAFWFGALPPLYLACTRESPAVAAKVTEAFSKIALWLVPGIFAAGLLLALGLIRDLEVFRTGYGVSLLAKVTGFGVLMGLAALNKWRLSAAIATGNERDLRLFRRSLGAEYILIAAVLCTTAVMTTFYSPDS